MINRWNPDIVITVGDNRYSEISYDHVVGQFYCDFLKDVESGPMCPGGNATTNAFFPTLGNHDYSDGGGLNEYLHYFQLPGSGVTSTFSSGNERYYEFVVGPVHFFALDSEQAKTNGIDLAVQQRWLRTALAGSTSPWQVVFFHYAAYSSGIVHGSSPFMQWPFESWGADVVIAGHVHAYERLQVGGIPYFVNGVGGDSLYAIGSPLPESVAHYDENYGAMLVTASDIGIQYEFYSISDGDPARDSLSDREIPKDSLICVNLNPATDTYIEEDEPSNNMGNDEQLKIKTKPDKQHRSLLAFDLSPLPPEIVIESASLSLWAGAVQDAPLDIQAHAVRSSWAEQEVTWNDRHVAPSPTWSIPGGDFDPDAAAMATVTDANTWISWDVTSLIPAWDDGSVYGVLLTGVQDGVKRTAKFTSSNSPDSDLHPKLQICHRVPDSNSCAFDSALWCDMHYFPVSSR